METQKQALGATLLNSEPYKSGINGKSGEIQRTEWRPSLHVCVVAIKKGAFVLPLTKITKFTRFIFYTQIKSFC